MKDSKNIQRLAEQIGDENKNNFVLLFADSDPVDGNFLWISEGDGLNGEDYVYYYWFSLNCYCEPDLQGDGQIDLDKPYEEFSVREIIEMVFHIEDIVDSSSAVVIPLLGGVV